MAATGQTGTGAVAIVGVGCRLPGGIADLTGLWSALAQGRDLVGTVPAERFEAERFVDGSMARTGKSYTAAGGFLDDIACFDAEFFGISPREAAQMDPQHRLLLETAVEALDDAAIDPAVLAGTDTGVFVGISDMAYGALQLSRPAEMNAYTMAGAASSIAANRVSHFLDLRGPSMAIDTACSSSLVAVERACQELWSGNSRVALAGGANVLLNPTAYVGFCQASMLSRKGRCAAFSAEADGFVRAEGAGMIVLKPLADAIADGDRIHAVIAGAGSNCDGRTMGLALPSAEAQEQLLRQVYARAGVSPDEMVYVEAHGTGTLVGDPAEATSLGRVLGMRRSRGALPIGSVKSNVGHLEPASGMAGLFKALLVLRHETIPASLHLDPLNPDIDFTGLGLEPVAAPRPLPDGPGRRFVGVNSFGFGGANAHLVLSPPPPVAETVEPPPPAQTGAAEEEQQRVLPLVASGRTPEAATSAAEMLADRVAAASPHELYDIAYTAVRRRALHPYRMAVLATGADQAAERLRTATPTRMLPSQESALGVVLMFSGNGSQWAGMGAELLADDTVFRQAVHQVDDALGPYLGWSVSAEMSLPPDEWRLSATEVAQPMLFAVQVGLVHQLRARGIEPAAVVGHSVGETAAAYAAGILTLDDAARVLAERSRAQALTAGCGRMAALGLTRDRAEELLAPFPEVEVAGVNAADQLTVSGPAEQLKLLAAEMAARKVFFRLLKLDYAFHSAAMEPVCDQLTAALDGLAPDSGTVPFISTLTGGPMDGTALEAEYWTRIVREPVLFAPAIDHLLERGHRMFVEIGPQPILRPYLRRIATARTTRTAGTAGTDAEAGHGDRFVSVATMRETNAGAQAVDAAAAELIAAGAEADWDRLFPRPGRVVELPAYPWQRERHWSGTPQAWTPRVGEGQLDHPLLGERLPTAEPSWHGRIEPALVPWLADHKLTGTVVWPAACHVEMALSAGRRVLGGPAELTWLEIDRPLVIPWDRAQEISVQLAVSPHDGLMSISSTETATGRPQALAHGRVRDLLGRPPGDVDLEELRARCPGEVDVQALYTTMADAGLTFGPMFRQLMGAWTGEGEALAAYRYPGDTADLDRYAVHPALLDGVLQAGAPLLAERLATGETFLPAAIAAVRLWRPPAAEGMVHVRDRTQVASEVCWDITVTDPDGAVTAELHGVRMRRLAGQAGTGPVRQHTVLRPAPHRDLPADRSPLPDDHQLAAAAGGRIERLREAWHRLPYASYTEPAEAAYAHGVTSVITGFLPDASAAFGIPDLRRHGLRTAAVPLVRSAVAIACRHGLLEPAGHERWRLARETERDALDARLTLEYPAFIAVTALMTRQLNHLPQLLRGQDDPLHLLLEDGSLPFFEQLYDVSPVCRFHNQVAAALMRQLVAAWPADRPLRILEVGAGTGGTTAALLPLLPPERTRYTFSDLSPAFFTRARNRFAAHDMVDYQTLDLNVDPVRQGFVEGGYDIVVAANALHTAGDLAAALGHVRRLLAPGGRLLAIESHDVVALQTIFGTLDGFWAHDDHDLRPSSPLLARDQWPGLLADCGFTDIVQTGDDQAPARDAYSVLLAATPDAPVTAPALPPAVDGPGWLLVTETPAETTLAERTAALLTARGADAVHTVTATADPQTWTELLNAHVHHPGGVTIVLLMADASAMRDGPSAMVDRATARAAILRALLTARQSIPLEARPTDNWPTLWVVTRPTGALPAPEQPLCPEDAAVWGMARTIASEHPDMAVIRLSLHRVEDPAHDAERLARELLTLSASERDRTDEQREDSPTSGSKREEDEIVLTPAGRFVPRETEVPASDYARVEQADQTAHDADDSPFVLRVDEPGLFYRLRWASTQPNEPGPGEVAIRVRAAALNYRDVMQVTGLLPVEAIEGTPSQHGVGLECAGTVTAVGDGVSGLAVGDRVAAVAPASLASHTVTRAEMVYAIADRMGFAEAATIPVAFLTVHHALGELARLSAGETVLVHGAAGGVGLAAIQYAKRCGATVIATAGNDTKREYLRALGVTHVLDSRTLDFVPQVLELTGGRGVDVVLNSLAGAALDRSLGLLAPGGRFLELGKRDIFGNQPLLLRPFRHNIAFFGVDLTTLISDRVQRRRLAADFTRSLNAGHYRPLPHSVYPAARVAEAFSLMQHSGHIGKVVVSLEPDDPVPVHVTPAPQRFDSGGTYLVTGGLGGFGAATARWLADHGARHLALLSRRGIEAPEAPALLDELNRQGVTATAYAADVSDPTAMSAVLDQIDATGHPLTGVVHAAMVLDDESLIELSDDRIRAVLAPKLAGAAILDTLTSHRDLKHFVLYSSYAAHGGNISQASYAAGNLYLEALSRRRRRAGRPGLTVALGHIADEGYVARSGMTQSLITYGILPISADSALAAMNVLLTEGADAAGIGRYDWGLARNVLATLNAPRFSALVPHDEEHNGRTRGDLLRDLAAATPSEATGIIADTLARMLADIMQLEADRIEPHQPLQELGIDSLMGTELLGRLRQQFDVEIPPLELLKGGGTLTALAQMVQARLGIHTDQSPA
ncbi:SDR family NAD(P)-dependent oxidoreductase [Actinomadura fulvescens]|uniref:Type I polyketide synthase n=1 Tax=Actinomadura fulvescens TaxID=46160 RepID=A0ABN3QW43_9ACTN